MSFFTPIFTRRVDTPLRQLALAVVLGSIIVFVTVQSCGQQGNQIALRNLRAGDVTSIDVAGQTIRDPAKISAIVTSLNDTEPFTFTEGGCYRPVRMLIVLRSSDVVQLAIARYGSENGALIQSIDITLPTCVYGRPLYSNGLVQSLEQAGIRLP